jgi:hypothetical protein
MTPHGSVVENSLPLEVLAAWEAEIAVPPELVGELAPCARPVRPMRAVSRLFCKLCPTGRSPATVGTSTLPGTSELAPKPLRKKSGRPMDGPKGSRARRCSSWTVLTGEREHVLERCNSLRSGRGAGDG